MRLAVLALTALIASAAVTFAHMEDGETVAYPPECCGGGDCAPIEKVSRNPDGSLLVTTKHGSATFPSDFAWTDFESTRSHACFSPYRLYCLLGKSGL